MSSSLTLRTANRGDQPQIIDVINGVYQEYGEIMCLENADQDLLDLEAWYFQRGGHFWVLDDHGQVVGTHAAHPLPGKPGACTFRRLYLRRELRGTGWGQALMQVTLDWAQQQGFRRIEFWSDTRFTRAHHFFEKLGFQRTGETRDMQDGILPYSEFFFFLDRLPSPPRS